MKKYLVLFLVIGLVFTNCKKNDDDFVLTPNPVAEQESEEEEEEEVVPVAKLVSDYPVQDFMWQTMNLYYFWQADVVDLADTKNDVEADYAEFLSTEADPSDFFFKICNNHVNVVGDASAIDRFSFLDEDYRNLVQGFAGISKSDGVEFGLARYGANNVFGFVRYIVPGSNAEGKDINRGDIFIGINGTDLTLDNYIDLLFGDLDTYIMNFATIEDNTISPNGRELSLTKEEGLNENPILISKVIEQGGLKIGYLLYNSFVADYDEQLNDAFGEFKAMGVNELILDFRYNGGGRVSSAVQIASSVYGTNTQEVFLTPRFNAKLQAANGSPDNFTDTTIDNTPLNALNLSRVYVITTSSTASASELVINGLEPYVDVVQVGTTTRGKNEFSLTFVDDPEAGNIYNPDREANINPANQWAIQPLIGRNENADGFSDYTAGLAPDHELEEDIVNLGNLGDPTEPLLALALNTISSASGKSSFEPVFPVELISSSAIKKVTNNKMLMDGLITAETISKGSNK